MEHSSIYIRPAVPEDAQALLGIYAYYVEKTAITFEYTVPSLAEFQSRMERTLKNYPYLVAAAEEEILGYAYAGPFIGRAAYDWSAETTIYLKEDLRKHGLGRKLYGMLEEICKAQNILNLNACIGYPKQEDEYLTKNSAQFHAHMGYRMVGEFEQCGYKFGRWYNMVWMEKILGEHRVPPEPVIPFSALSTQALRSIGLTEKPDRG